MQNFGDGRPELISTAKLFKEEIHVTYNSENHQLELMVEAIGVELQMPENVFAVC